MAAETPTIVLVHGAWADATGFDAEIRALQRPRVYRHRVRQPASRPHWRRDLPRRIPADPDRSDRARRPLLRRQCHLQRRDRQRPGAGARLLQRLDVRRGRDASSSSLSGSKAASSGPAIRPVPYTAADGSEGTDLFLDPEAFREAFAADVDPETAAVMAAAQRPYAAAAFEPRRRARRRGRRCRAGICSAPRTRRSRRRSSGSWPSARTRRSWRCRPLTSRSCRSPRPRPSSSFRPSRRPAAAADQRRCSCLAAGSRGLRYPLVRC